MDFWSTDVELALLLRILVKLCLPFEWPCGDFILVMMARGGFV